MESKDDRRRRLQREASKRWRDRNQDYVRAYARNYVKQHRKEISARHKEMYRESPRALALRRARSRKYQNSNKGRVTMARWRRSNLGWLRIYQRELYALEKLAPRVDIQTWLFLRKSANNNLSAPTMKDSTMMNKDKSFALQQRWSKLTQRKSDLDWDITAFAADLRAEFETGRAGDTALVRWCEIELKMPPYVAQELILRATAFEVTKDKTRYASVGGFVGVRQVVRLSKKQQVHVLQSAVLQNKTVRSVMRGQGLLPESPPPVENPDAQALAEFIAAHNLALPKRVKAIVDRYITKTKLRSVA